MWSRRHFLETLSSLPLVRGLFVGSPALTGLAMAPPKDYFRELGVRPFINAAGTYTDMTASLMRPEVMQAISYASQHYVMLNDLHDRVGEKIAALVRCEAAMVTSGAASAITLGRSRGSVIRPMGFSGPSPLWIHFVECCCGSASITHTCSPCTAQ